jgi:hypothetical protein
LSDLVSRLRELALPGRGQGTVEYLGLLAAIALLLIAVSTQLKNGGGVPKEIADGFVGAVKRVVGQVR